MNDTLKGSLVILGALGLMVLLIYAAIVEQREWNEFARTHDCRVVEKIPSKTTYGSAYVDGKYVSTSHTTPARTAYLCNDGVKYWR